MKFSRQKPPPKAPLSRSGISGNGGACRRSTPALSAMTQLGLSNRAPAGVMFCRLASPVHSTGLWQQHFTTVFLHPSSSHQPQLAVWASLFLARRYVIKRIRSLNGYTEFRIVRNSCNAVEAGPFIQTPLANDHVARIFSPSSARRPDMPKTFMPSYRQLAFGQVRPSNKSRMSSLEVQLLSASSRSPKKPIQSMGSRGKLAPRELGTRGQGLPETADGWSGPKTASRLATENYRRLSAMSRATGPPYRQPNPGRGLPSQGAGTRYGRFGTRRRTDMDLSSASCS
ncbi:hypothetical protein Landi51_05697 [Colletotrichum acutatum]